MSMLVSSAAFNLQLGVASRTFLSSGSLPSAFLSSAAASEREIWFSRGQGFCISFRLLLDGKQLRTNDLRDAGLIEDFAKVLRDAELWTQLQLQASLTLPSHDHYRSDNPPTDIVIHLNHFITGADALGSSQQATNISLFSSADVKPPPGIPIAIINEVQLTLAFSTNIQGSPPPHKVPKRPKTESYFLNNEHWPIPEPFDEKIWPPQSVESARHKGCHGPLPRSEDTVSLQPDSTSPSLRLLQPPREFPDRPLKKRAADASESVAAEIASYRRPQLEHMVLLVDVALRNLVTKNPFRTPPGVVLAGAAPEFRLSEVAPSLWSPGYLTAISMRSRFLTVISWAISFPMYSYVRSTALKLKLERLSSLPPSPIFYSQPTSTPEESHPHSQDYSTSAAIHSVIQARLWRLMQQGLYNPDAARRLKPVELISRHESDAPGRPSEMLLEDEMASSLEALLWDGIAGGSSRVPGTLGGLEGLNDDDMLTDFQDCGEDDLLLERYNEPMPPGCGPPDFENWHRQSITKGKNYLLDLDGDDYEMLATETQPIMEENHEFLYEIESFCGSELDFSQVLQENELSLVEGEGCSVVSDVHGPICDADLLDVHELGAFAGTDSLQGFHEEEEAGENQLVEGDLLFSARDLVHLGQQCDFVEDEMLF
ncbi:MAG: hypothetical protein M1839_007891 [Geoglossum umbratile]|nr:MAG: hypothetical protein M1839_007891 [Geoglossum umbratile]